MSTSVNFTGKLYIDKTVNKLMNKHEKKSLNGIAKKINCDIMVLDRDVFEDGSTAYSTIVGKKDKGTGLEDVFSYVFGFKKK